MRRVACLLVCGCLMFGPGAPVCVAAELALVGIESGQAQLTFADGNTRTLAVGQAANGVRLISLTEGGAVVEVDGRRRFLPVPKTWQDALAASPPADAGAQPTPLRLKRSAGDGRFYAEGTINKMMTRFLIDTGAAQGIGLVIGKDEAKRMGFDFSRARRRVLYGAAGQTEVWQYTCHEATIGHNIVLRDIPCVVDDKTSWRRRYVLLGMDVLQHLSMHYEGDDLVLSLKTVRQAAPTAEGEILLRQARDGRFYAEGKINGVAARLLVDTGATGGVSMSLAQARQLGIDPRRTPPAYYVRKPHGGERLPIWKMTLDTVQIGESVVHQVECTIGWEMSETLIGMDFLQRFYVRREGDRLILTRRF
ncbi:MAG: TIGR02281 family clan AA aspartic protease [Zoogloeaceae bacterium]|jgi:aspartyl protease family protein|nr:TIGR02281 family clan AA aspartic protease [Zoogloeaceae bacterium]